MPTKKRHVWVSATVKGKTQIWCERCGCDRSSTEAKAGCRPTTLPGF